MRHMLRARVRSTPRDQLAACSNVRPYGKQVPWIPSAAMSEEVRELTLRGRLLRNNLNANLE